ncbi:hypothetical protein ACFX13_040898 [Malus domestica]
MANIVMSSDWAFFVGVWSFWFFVGERRRSLIEDGSEEEKERKRRRWRWREEREERKKWIVEEWERILRGRLGFLEDLGVGFQAGEEAWDWIGED